jgi:multidrug efflux pump subunit AcrA (membrane-fusion protein)
VSNARLLALVAVLAAAGLAFAGRSALQLRRPPAPALAMPPPSPIFADRVTGIGLLEPAGRSTRVGVHEPGVVAEVLVKEGDEIAEGAPLLRIDDRLARAELARQQAALAERVAERDRLRRLPRAEDLPPLAAAVAEAAARLDDASDRRVRGDALAAKRLINEEEASGRRHVEEVAKRASERAGTELARARAGAWGPDLAFAEVRIATAEAEVEVARQRLERLTVRAPKAGRVYAVEVRAGERIDAGSAVAVVLGERELQLRLEIDESLADRLRPDAPARAWVRGIPGQVFELEAVRIDPLAIGKRSFAGVALEREDARVVQALYRFHGSTPGFLRPGMMLEAEVRAGAIPTNPTARVAAH